MRSMTPASASAASLPPGGGAMTTFAPSVRNSCVSLCSASRLTFNRAEQTAAPLDSATRASASRPRLAPSNFHRIRKNIERVATSSLSPQYGSGIGARCAFKRHEAPGKRHHPCQDQNDWKKDPSKGGSNAKNFNSQDSRHHNSQRVSRDATHQREQQLLGNKKCADGAMARAQRLHQSNFRAAFEHRGRGRGAHGKRCGKQRRDRHQPHQTTDASQNPALTFGHL